MSGIRALAGGQALDLLTERLQQAGRVHHGPFSVKFDLYPNGPWCVQRDPHG